MGRTRKSSWLKAIDGNPGNRAIPKDEPRPAAADPVEEPPAHLSREGKRIWRREWPVVARMQIVGTVDRSLFASMCEAQATWNVATRMLNEEGLVLERQMKNGSVVRYRHPAVDIRDRAAAELHRCRDRLGMSPSGRAGLSKEKCRPAL